MRRGHSQPAVGITLHPEYAVSWFHQVVQPAKHDAADYFWDTSYMMANVALNIVSEHFLVFLFFKSKDTQQGTPTQTLCVSICCFGHSHS